MEPSIQLYTHVNLNFSHEKFTCYNTFSKLMFTRTTDKKKTIKLQNHLKQHMSKISLKHREDIPQST